MWMNSQTQRPWTASGPFLRAFPPHHVRADPGAGWVQEESGTQGGAEVEQKTVYYLGGEGKKACYLQWHFHLLCVVIAEHFISCFSY